MLKPTSQHSKYSRRYNPYHPLAQIVVKQIDKLELHSQDIVKMMGYPTEKVSQACDRLRYVLCNEQLGLRGWLVDDYFTAEAFLQKLLSVLNIDSEPFQDGIALIQYEITHYPNPLPKYILRANINFNFCGANWMSRGSASRLANVKLPDKFARLNELKRESVIQVAISTHYHQYHDSLPYQGVITGYRLITKQENEITNTIEYELPKSK